jgi:hypothetical protein
MSQADMLTPVAAPLPQPLRPQLASVGRQGDELSATVEAALVTLRKLSLHAAFFETAALATVERTVIEVERRLARQELRVIVVGERQSGKSTLLDAIVGNRLLGGARGRSSLITAIRCRESPRYLARFASGETEDFSERVPDRSPEFVEAAAQLRQSLADAKGRCAAARTEFRRALELREDSQSALTNARAEAEGAREGAGAATSWLTGLQSEVSRIETALAEVERHVPKVLQRTPPRWAFLAQWLVRLCFELFKRQILARYRALVTDRREIGVKLLEGRERAAASTKEQIEAQARLEDCSTSLGAAETRARESERALRAVETGRDAIAAELDVLRSELEHYESDRRRQFLDDVRDLCGEPGRERGLVELSLDYPVRLLPHDVTIIDMPGMLSDDASEWNAIREDVDGCILVSELDRGVSESAKRLLRRVRDIVPHLLLVLTKVDQAFAEAVSRGEKDPWERVEHARRIGTRRFARELGRDADSVLSVAVSAEGALRPQETELTRRFEGEIAKLFQLLRHERALILGARAASAVRRCIAGITESEQRAERAYRERIAELEQQRLPPPEVFADERLAAAHEAIAGAARHAVAQGVSTMQTGLPNLKRLAASRFDSSRRRRDLIDAAEGLSKALSEQATGIRRLAHLAVQTEIEQGSRAIVTGLLDDLRRRYYVVSKVNDPPESTPQIGATDHDVHELASMAVDIRDAVHSFQRQRYMLAAAGMLLGAVAGACVQPWIGILGAMIGTLLWFARPKSKLRERTAGLAAAAIDGLERRYIDELRSLEPSMVSAIRDKSKRSLERAIVRHEQSIAGPIEAEQRAIDSERDKLSALEQLKVELAQHDREIERRVHAAADASVGLCR